MQFLKNRTTRILLLLAINISALLFIYPILSVLYKSYYIPYIIACFFSFLFAEASGFSTKSARIIVISTVVLINIFVVAIVDFGIYEANECLVPFLPECGF